MPEHFVKNPITTNSFHHCFLVFFHSTRTRERGAKHEGLPHVVACDDVVGLTAKQFEMGLYSLARRFLGQSAWWFQASYRIVCCRSADDTFPSEVFDFRLTVKSSFLQSTC